MNFVGVCGRCGHLRVMHASNIVVAQYPRDTPCPCYFLIDDKPCGCTAALDRKKGLT